MRGLVVDPGRPGSARVVDDLPEPDADRGRHPGRGPDGRHLRHRPGDRRRRLRRGARRRAVRSSSGTSRSAGSSSDARRTFAPGDLVAGVVRRPDPVPCPNCAVGEWDMCRNGSYTECGIKQRHGFARERWRVEPDFAVTARPGPGRRRRPARADERGREGLGTHRTDRAPGLAGQPRDRPGHRRRTDRPARRAARRRSAGSTCTSSTGSPTGRSPIWSAGSAPPTTPATVRRARPHPRHRARVHRRADRSSSTSSTRSGPDGIVCLTGVSTGGRPTRRRHRTGQPQHRAGEQRGLRLGQRQPAALAGGRRRRCAPPIRTGVGSLITRRVPLARFADALHREARTTSRWSLTLRCDDASRGPAPGPARAVGLPRRHRRRHRC